jgi:acetylornithine deacetylase/succinyl-diaminopimelate desuccinylase-like protein
MRLDKVGRSLLRRTLVMVAVIGGLLSGTRADSGPALASSTISAERMNQYSDLAVQWMQEYFRIDTTNPPGNELRAAAWMKHIFDAEGIESRIFEYAPDRADLWARLPATTVSPKRPLVLLNHTDVVTSDAAHWTQPPFSGNVVNGVMYGRGAQDMKDEGLAQLVVMVMLKREKVALDRDVIFLAVADEEAGGTGTDWFIARKPELLGNAEFLINEGGENLLEANGKVKFVSVDVGEKSPFWLHVVAHGVPGHGSRPNSESAPNRLVRALDRISHYQTPLRVLPVVEEFFREMAQYEPPERAAKFRNLRESLKDKSFAAELERDESLNYLLRDTISLTMLGGSAQTNVIPPDAWANLDVRLLPGADPKEFLESIRRLVNDPNASVEPLNQEFRLANSSGTDNAMFAAFRKVSAHYFPGTPVVPKITSGYTENQRYRPLGIASYGYSPYAATEEEGNTEHGNDERIRIEELRRGFRVLYDVVGEVAGKR